MSDDILLEADRLTFDYGLGPVVDDLSLAVRSGRFYGVLGPNGSGKTTLLDLLLGSKQPETGEVRYKGRPLADYQRRHLARKMALAPQEFVINFPFTVQEVVLMGRHPHMERFGKPSREDLEKAQYAMTQVGVVGLSEKFVTDLSGGEKQRVVLARALAQDPKILFLDEPTSNLDIKYALYILALTRRRVHEEGRTAVAVLHDLNLAAAFCDELFFLKAGQVQASGPVEEVLTSDNILRVFGVEAKVDHDEFSKALRAAFKKEDLLD